MRNYPVNSPQAAARIIALTTVAEAGWPGGHVDVMRGLRLVEQLGLDGPAWHDVLTGVCQDLMFSARTSFDDGLHVDGPALEHLLAEVQDPALQHKVLELCLSLADRQQPIGDSESMLLASAVDQWGLTDEVLA